MKAEMEISLEHMRSDPGNRGYIDEVKKQSDTMAAYEKGMAQLYGGTPQMITENKIPDSHICFADEIFKANEGVLNSLLKALNERTYTNEGVTVKIPVISFVSASNEIPNFNDPEEQSLRALYDRFDFKVNTRYVEAKENRMRMLKSKQSRKSDKPTHTVTLSELEAMQEEVRQIPIPQSINELADTILCELRRKKIPVSDRTYFNFGAVVQAEAWLNGRTTVAPVDMQALVNYLWDKPEQYEVIREVITRLTENPLGKKLDAALARAYACRDAFRATNDKNQALLTFRSGMVAVLQDDRFDRLKQLCEDKELPAFEAAHAFRNTLIDRLPQNTNILVPLKLLSVYDRLREKENQVTQALLSGKDGLSEKRRLFLYNRVYRLKKQQRDLEQKLREAAISYVDELGFAIGDAIEAALTQATEVNTVMTAWGTENGTMQNDEPNRELLAHVRNSKELLAVAKTLGRYKDIIADKRKNGFTYGLGEKYDLTFGNDITNCLSGELAMLGIAETEILFMRKYEQRRLMQYRKRTASIKGRGDMIVLLDESGSTKSVASWAKAFALALLDIAAKDKRKYALIRFSSAEQVKTDLFEPGHYAAEDVMRAAEQFFGGGTDFEAPLKEALRLMQSGYEKADITIITDGKCQLPDTFCRRLLDELRTYRATVTGILLDKGGSCGETLKPFCDKIYRSSELTEDEIAVEILKEKAS